MAWVKLDAGFFSNPKAIRAGKDARALYVAGLCYCARGLTDGHIEAGALMHLAVEADVYETEDLAQRLVRVGLWDQVTDGFQVHDYLDYQPSSDQVKRKRAAAVTRMRETRSREHGDVSANMVMRSRELSAHNGDVRANGVCHWAEEVGEVRFAQAAAKFSALNVQLHKAWLRHTVSRYEGTAPAEQVTACLASVRAELEDTFTRDPAGIKNPQAFAATRIERALREAKA